jgi:hypothetical protein
MSNDYCKWPFIWTTYYLFPDLSILYHCTSPKHCTVNTYCTVQSEVERLKVKYIYIYVYKNQVCPQAYEFKVFAKWDRGENLQNIFPGPSLNTVAAGDFLISGAEDRTSMVWTLKCAFKLYFQTKCKIPLPLAFMHRL